MGKKHAFLIIAHKQPLLLRRIVKRLQSKDHYFFIHIDKNNKDFDSFRSGLSDIDNIVFIERLNVFHGGISLVDCELALLRSASNYNVHIDYFHLISGQDYPLVSNDVFDAFFEDSSRSYMYYDSDVDSQKWQNTKYHTRVNLWYLNKTNSFFAKCARKLKVPQVLGRVFPRKKIPNLTGGWQWFSWERTVATFVLNYVAENADYYKRYENTYLIDELFFHTILNKRFDELNIDKSNSLRYVSWRANRPILEKHRPYILNELDFDVVSNSGAFFCRKIQLPESEKLLDLIDQNLETV